MSVGKFLTLPRKGVGYCTTLFALAILAAPGLTWGDDCNDSGSISKSPGGPYLLGETVRFTYTFGSEGNTTAGLVLTVDNDEVFVALDCGTAASGSDRENCLGYHGAAAADAADDGPAIAFAGNLDWGNAGRCSNDAFLTCTADADCGAGATCDNVGDACPDTAGWFTVAPGHGDGIPEETDPNIIVFKAASAIQLDRGESCWVAFDAYVNGIGLPANWEAGDQYVNAAAGFTGQCTDALGASSTKSTNYQIDITPDITLRKEVSVDGGPWEDANNPVYPIGIVPSSTAMYRLIVENIGEEALTNVRLTDNTPPFFLGLDDVPLPDRCYDADGFFAVGATCTIISGDTGFAPLGDVLVCETAGTKTNEACVDGEGAATGSPVNACDPATVVCVEPGIEVRKDGETLAKVGDTINYDICADNTGQTDLNNCVVNDALLGLTNATFPDLPVGATNVCLTPAPPYTIPSGAPNPLLNTASVTCNVVGTASDTVTDNDNHSVDLIDPSIDVTKTGPPIAKVGDVITYTIGFTETGTGTLGVCTGNDPLLNPDGDLGVFTAGVPRNFNYTVQAGDSNPLVNTATITCEVEGFDNTASDDDSHSVDLIDPSIEVTKSGPPIAKVGDTITYTIGFTETGTGTLENCTGDDDVIGPLGPFTAGVPRDFDYTVQAGDPDPLVNIATITCDVADFDNQASDDDTHSVDIIDPSIDVTKSGPDRAKVGDTITYTIGFTETGTGTLENCTGDDDVIGPLGAFTAGVPRDFDYTVQAGDPDPLVNIATITCDVADFDNQASDNDTHSVDLIDPSVDLVKECTPDPVPVGDTINWAITINNTGDIDLNCLVNDPTAGFIDEPVTVAAGGSEVINAGRTVETSDVPVISNTATVDCPIEGFDNSVSDEDTADCEVTQITELCRTPGFWKAHAGTEKENRSNNLTQAVIDYNGGTLGTICGVEIMDTSTHEYPTGTGYDVSNGYASAVEGMCVHPKQRIVRQLQRQLIAAALNCVASGGDETCTGVSVGPNWKLANASCLAEDGEMSSWIDEIDDFNNGVGDYTCSENIKESIVFEGWTGPKLPGPAGSSWACGEATSNDFYLVPLPSGVDP